MTHHDASRPLFLTGSVEDLLLAHTQKEDPVSLIEDKYPHTDNHYKLVTSGPGSDDFVVDAYISPEGELNVEIDGQVLLFEHDINLLHAFLTAVADQARFIRSQQ